MTANAINYWKLQEEKLHNRITEREAQRHNVEAERIGDVGNEVGFRQAAASAAAASAARRQAEVAAQRAKMDAYYNEMSYQISAARTEAEVALTMARASLTQAQTDVERYKADLTKAQSEVEGYRAGLIQAQVGGEIISGVADVAKTIVTVASLFK